MKFIISQTSRYSMWLGRQEGGERGAQLKGWVMSIIWIKWTFKAGRDRFFNLGHYALTKKVKCHRKAAESDYFWHLMFFIRTKNEFGLNPGFNIATLKNLRESFGLCARRNGPISRIWPFLPCSLYVVHKLAKERSADKFYHVHCCRTCNTPGKAASCSATMSPVRWLKISNVVQEREGEP